jgi:uncharacterized membrane protein
MENLMGIFPDKKSADMVFDELIKSGYDKSDISLVVKEDKVYDKEGEKGGLSTSDITTGVVIGGVAGGIAGILIGLGSIAVPGLGALIFAGPLAAVLGLSGIAAVTVSGATTGILAGGLTGALVEMGLSVTDARFFERRLKQGGVFMAVPVQKQRNADEVERLFAENGAENIRRIKDKEIDRNYI